MDSTFAILNLHRKKRFKSVLTKEFSALADEEGKPVSFPNFYLVKTSVKRLRNKLNQTRSQGMWLRQKTKIWVNLWDASRRNPFP